MKYIMPTEYTTSYTTSQVAKALDLTTGSIRRLARQHDIGRMTPLGRLFTLGDIDRITKARRRCGPHKN